MAIRLPCRSTSLPPLSPKEFARYPRHFASQTIRSLGPPEFLVGSGVPPVYETYPPRPGFVVRP